jgi:hypothetical protein
MKSSNWWGKIGISVWIFTSWTNNVLFSMFDSSDIHSYTYKTLLNSLIDKWFSFLITFNNLCHHWEPETFSFFIPFDWLVTFLLHVFIVIIFLNVKRSASESTVIKCLFKVEGARTNNIIALKEVSIVCLDSQTIVLTWMLNFEF